MKVKALGKCLEPGISFNLTKGKFYKITDIEAYTIAVINNNKQKRYCYSSRFEIIDNKITKILYDY